jgi:hypothetical protein
LTASSSASSSSTVENGRWSDRPSVLPRMITNLEISELQGVAKAFGEMICARWPEFLQHASTRQGSLWIELPAPSGATTLWIRADVDFDEVIIGIGGGHSHGGEWEQADDPDYRFEASVRFIGDILADRVVGCSHCGGGGSIGTLDHLRAVPWWRSVVEVRSWTGVHDEIRKGRTSRHS